MHAIEIPRDGGDSRKQLAVENEILAKRLACAEAVAGDDLPQRLRISAQMPSAR
jgi:hypothetical protein